MLKGTDIGILSNVPKLSNKIGYIISLSRSQLLTVSIPFKVKSIYKRVNSYHIVEGDDIRKAKTSEEKKQLTTFNASK